MSVPLVGTNADIYANRLYSQRTRNIYNTIVCLRICNSICTLWDFCIFRSRSACSSICLRTFKVDWCYDITTGVASYCIIWCVGKITTKRCSVICFRFVVSNNYQFFLIINIDYQIAFIASNLICCLRSRSGSVKVCMVIYKAIRSLVLYCKGVSFFNIGSVRIFNYITIHIKIVNRDFCCSIWYILKRNLIILKSKLEFLWRLCWLVVLTKYFRVICLRSKVCRINFFCHFHNVCCRSWNGYCFRFCNLDFRTLQHIVNCILDFCWYRIIIENNSIFFSIEREFFSYRCFVRYMSCNGRCCLGNFLAFGKSWIRNYFIRKDACCCPLLIIVNSIANGILCPVSI